MENTYLIQRSLEKIYNRLHRYRNKLAKEGIEEIKNQNLKLIVREDRGLRLVNGLPTIWVGKSETDLGDLIKLSKARVPSLYRRYYSDLERMKKILMLTDNDNMG